MLEEAVRIFHQLMAQDEFMANLQPATRASIERFLAAYYRRKRGHRAMSRRRFESIDIPVPISGAGRSGALGVLGVVVVAGLAWVSGATLQGGAGRQDRPPLHRGVCSRGSTSRP